MRGINVDEEMNTVSDIKQSNDKKLLRLLPIPLMLIGDNNLCSYFKLKTVCESKSKREGDCDTVCV